MGNIFTNLWSHVWNSIIDNRQKLTATGGFLLGIFVTLGFKDFYPDLEQAFRKRVRHVRSTQHHHPPPQPGQADYVQLEDRTKSASAATASASAASTTPDPIREGVAGLIGNTPLIKLQALSAATGCEILAKAEFLNGAGNSPKDRVALSMITHAEEAGLLVPHRGDTIYEGTVGSTGISLAAVARARGYKAHMYVLILCFYAFVFVMWEELDVIILQHISQHRTAQYIAVFVHSFTHSKKHPPHPPLSKHHPLTLSHLFFFPSHTAACPRTSPPKNPPSSCTSAQQSNACPPPPSSTRINSSTSHVAAQKNILWTRLEREEVFSQINSKIRQIISRIRILRGRKFIGRLVVVQVVQVVGVVRVGVVGKVVD